MNKKRVATLNAGRFKLLFQYLKNWKTITYTVLLLLVISCTKSDDIDTINNGSPIENETPVDEVSLIIYTDIKPDFTSKTLGDSFNLDLNNDQIMDFTLSSLNNESGDWLFIASNPLVKNGIISAAPWYSNPVPIDTGREIYNLRGYKDGEFYETTSFFYFGRCPGGDSVCPYDWENKRDKYLGLKFIIKGKIHYGWARMDIFSPTQWIIKDYAFNATPDKPILAGQIE